MKNKILFIVATHGNEEFAIPVFEELEKKYPKKDYNYDWIIGNPKALEQQKRFLDADLNRSAPGDINSDVYEEKRAAEIIELSKDFDFVIDIHETISDLGLVKIIPYPTLQNLILACSIPIEKNVIWYSKSSLKKGPLSQYCQCSALEIECGPKNDLQVQKKLSQIIEGLIVGQELESLINVSRTSSPQEFYYVYGQELDGRDGMEDFVKTENKGEVYYPFLTRNQYDGIKCYKTRKINFEQLFLY